MDPVSLIQQSEEAVMAFLRSPASHEPLDKSKVQIAWVALNDVTKATHLSEAAVGGVMLWITSHLGYTTVTKGTGKEEECWAREIATHEQRHFDVLSSFARDGAVMEELVVAALANLQKQMTARALVVRSRSASCVVPSASGAALEYDATPWCEVLFGVTLMISEKAVEKKWTRAGEIQKSVADMLRVLPGGDAYIHCALSEVVWREWKNADAGVLEVPVVEHALSRVSEEKTNTAVVVFPCLAPLVEEAPCQLRPLQQMIQRVVPELKDGDNVTDNVFSEPQAWETRMPYSYYENLRIMMEDGSAHVIGGITQLQSPFDFPRDVTSGSHSETEKFLISLS